MDLLADYLWLIIALPLAGAVALHFGGKFLPEPRPGLAAVGAIGTAFLIAAAAFIPLASGEAEPHILMLWDWMPGIGAAFEIRWDQLSALMTLIITGVGTLIHIYSIGYMHGDPRFSRFFTYLNLFAASMHVPDAEALRDVVRMGLVESLLFVEEREGFDLFAQSLQESRDKG